MTTQYRNADNHGVQAVVPIANGGGTPQTTGDVAHDAVDGGNPTKVGFKANSSAPAAVTAGDRVDGWAFLAGQQAVALVDGSGNVVGVSQTDADGISGVRSFPVRSGGYGFNGATWDRQRNNIDATVFASVARTATPTPFDGTNYNGRGLHLVIDCTAITATPSVVFTVQGKDAISGKFYTILESAAITGTGTTVLKVYPGLTAAANTVASDILPRSWRVIATHADADSITYSVGASVIL